jgi:hypothetical protein
MAQKHKNPKVERAIAPETFVTMIPRRPNKIQKKVAKRKLHGADP